MITIEDVAYAILDCEPEDFSVIKNTKYNVCKIIKELVEGHTKPTINNILYEIFDTTLNALSEEIRYRIDEINADIELQVKRHNNNTNEFYKNFYDMHQERNALMEIDPFDDIVYSYNPKNVYISIQYNEDIYRKYFSRQLSKLEDKMGFKFVSLRSLRDDGQ